MRGSAGFFVALAVVGCADASPHDDGSGGGGLTAGLTTKGDDAQTSTDGEDSTSGSSAGEGTMGSATTGFPKLDLGELPDVGVGAETSGEDCTELVATVRDFQASHADFETYGGNAASVGLVENDLDAMQQKF